MLNSIFDQSTLPVLQKMAKFGERRHEVLAGNIANIDVPNYKMRDLPVEDFQAALKAAINRKGSEVSPGLAEVMGPMKTPDISEFFSEELFRPAQASSKNLTFHDGNNRNVEFQMMELTKNNMMQTFAIELMSAQMNLLQSVISERA